MFFKKFMPAGERTSLLLGDLSSNTNNLNSEMRGYIDGLIKAINHSKMKKMFRFAVLPTLPMVGSIISGLVGYFQHSSGQAVSPNDFNSIYDDYHNTEYLNLSDPPRYETCYARHPISPNCEEILSINDYLPAGGVCIELFNKLYSICETLSLENDLTDEPNNNISPLPYMSIALAALATGILSWNIYSLKKTPYGAVTLSGINGNPEIKNILLTLQEKYSINTDEHRSVYEVLNELKIKALNTTIHTDNFSDSETKITIISRT
ncbi:MAG: hypothetical protein H0U71_08210 [Gammaproteobacteria bacterium]|nr:hypothetical protein [Gammaproteobacteria bacterium]